MKRSVIFVELLVVVLCTTSVCGGPLTAADPLNYFEDLIRESIGMSVKELLQLTQNTFNSLNSITENGVEELENLSTIATPEVKEALEKIRSNVAIKILEIVQHLLADLGSVLPILALPADKTDPIIRAIGEFSAADIIYTILGISLEDLVILIRNSFQRSADLLTSTMTELEELAQVTSPEVASALRNISENRLMVAKSVVMPVLHQFDKLVTRSQDQSS